GAAACPCHRDLLGRVRTWRERLAYDATPFVPWERDLESLRKAAASCQGRDLYKTRDRSFSAKALLNREWSWLASNRAIKRTVRVIPSSDQLDICSTKR